MPINSNLTKEEAQKANDRTSIKLITDLLEGIPAKNFADEDIAGLQKVAADKVIERKRGA